MIAAAVIGALVIVVGGFFLLRPGPSTAQQIAKAIDRDSDGTCMRVTTQRAPARDDDASGFQARATYRYLITCEKTGPGALIIEYPSRIEMSDALQLRARSPIFRDQQICVLEKSLVIGSFQHEDALAKECAKLGGEIRGPIAKP